MNYERVGVVPVDLTGGDDAAASASAFASVVEINKNFTFFLKKNVVLNCTENVVTWSDIGFNFDFCRNWQWSTTSFKLFRIIDFLQKRFFFKINKQNNKTNLGILFGLSLVSVFKPSSTLDDKAPKNLNQ